MIVLTSRIAFFFPGGLDFVECAVCLFCIYQAPEEWLKQNHPAGKERWRHQPNYAILVDSRDRPGVQITYVPQENIKLTPKLKVRVLARLCNNSKRLAGL